MRVRPPRLVAAAGRARWADGRVGEDGSPGDWPAAALSEETRDRGGCAPVRPRRQTSAAAPQRGEAVGVGRRGPLPVEASGLGGRGGTVARSSAKSPPPLTWPASPRTG